MKSIVVREFCASSVSLDPPPVAPTRRVPPRRGAPPPPLGVAAPPPPPQAASPMASAPAPPTWISRRRVIVLSPIRFLLSRLEMGSPGGEVQTPVDEQVGARGVRRVVGGEEHHRSRDLRRWCHPAH